MDIGYGQFGNCVMGQAALSIAKLRFLTYKILQSVRLNKAIAMARVIEAKMERNSMSP
jgi:hypothetical protein